jgi:DNA ligase-1
VETLNQQTPSFVEVAPKQVCEGMNHMESFLQDIIDEGGEGIILRDPFSPYQPGRSSGYLKHKVHLFPLSLSFGD